MPRIGYPFLVYPFKISDVNMQYQWVESEEIILEVSEQLLEKKDLASLVVPKLFGYLSDNQVYINYTLYNIAASASMRSKVAFESSDCLKRFDSEWNKQNSIKGKIYYSVQAEKRIWISEMDIEGLTKNG